MILENIERLCREHNISISALEKTVGLANATIRNWNTSSPRVSSIKAVADYFGVTLDELIREE